MERKVRLLGERFDLEDLPELFTLPSLRILTEGEDYFLQASSLDSLDDSAAVLKEARNLIRIVNGIMAVRRAGYRPVQVGDQVHDTSDEGGVRVSVHLSDTIVARAKTKVTMTTIGAGGALRTNPDQRPEEHLRRALGSEAVRKVLGLMSEPPLDWVNLYKVLELIEDAEGTSVAVKGWCSNKARSRFRHTANSAAAAGDLARHATETTRPPQDPMTLQEGRDFIRQLVRHWLDAGQGSA